MKDRLKLIVPMDKSWTKEARAAALAARKAKQQGKDPKAAAETAKKLVREGSTVKHAVETATSGTEKKRPKYQERMEDRRDSKPELFGEGDPNGAIKFVTDSLQQKFKRNKDVEWDRDNHHDSELISIYSRTGDKKTEKMIERTALRIEEAADHPGVTAAGWTKSGPKNRYYTIDVNGLEFP